MPKQYGNPGPRLIYPESCDSDTLAACDAMAQFLFDRLIVQADDQGRLPGDPVQVKARCMPRIAEATPRRIAQWLGQLVAHGLIRLYGSDGYRLLQIEAWWKHQGSMRRAYPSRWPAPEGWSDRVYGLPKGAETPQPAGTLRAPSAHPAAETAPSASTSANANARADASSGADAAEILWTLTGRYPTDRLLKWIDDLAAQYGHDVVSQHIVRRFKESDDQRTLMGRVSDTLRREARQLEQKEREQEQQRLAEKRSRPALVPRTRIEATPPEEVERQLEEYRRGVA